jgi:hypothetical protein
MKKSLLSPELFTERICEGTYTALKHLIESSYYSQVGFQNTQRALSQLAWWKEYCTIKMACSRRSGHTTAIGKLIPEYFNRALILAPNLEIAKRLSQVFIDGHDHATKEDLINNEPILKKTAYTISTETSEYTFGSVGSLDRYRSEKYQAIVVDVTCMLSNKDMDNIYDLGICMNCYPENFFIFVE